MSEQRVGVGAPFAQRQAALLPQGQERDQAGGADVVASPAGSGARGMILDADAGRGSRIDCGHDLCAVR